jgi:hypothetical protein
MPLPLGVLQENPQLHQGGVRCPILRRRSVDSSLQGVGPRPRPQLRLDAMHTVAVLEFMCTQQQIPPHLIQRQNSLALPQLELVLP